MDRGTNRAERNAEFGHKQGEGFGKWAAHSHPTFLEVSPSAGGSINRMFVKHVCEAKIVSVTLVQTQKMKTPLVRVST